MDAPYLELLRLRELTAAHPAALRSLFWQFGAGPEPVPDPVLEKESWINRVTLEWGCCGCNLREQAEGPAAATVLFAPPRFTPAARRLPTAPVSPDAVLLSSLHVDRCARGRGYETALVQAVLRHLAGRGVRAVEAFGCNGPDPASKHPGQGDIHRANCGDDPAECRRPADGTPCPGDTAPEAACAPGALGDVAHGAGDLPETTVLLGCGFTVVAPHHRHPRVRREIDPDLDWGAAVTAALDQLAAAQYYSSASFSRSSMKLNVPVGRSSSSSM